MSNSRHPREGKRAYFTGWGLKERNRKGGSARGQCGKQLPPKGRGDQRAEVGVLRNNEFGGGLVEWESDP